MSRRNNRKCPPVPATRRAPRRAPLPRGQGRQAAPAAEPHLGGVTEAQVKDVGTDALNVLIAQHFEGNAEAAFAAIHESVASHAALSNLARRASVPIGLADRLALGVLWHLYLSKHDVQAQVALQGAAITVAGFERDKALERAVAAPTLTEDGTCGDPTCPDCAPTKH